MAPFQIGLVLSGGATAGSYTAGVIDFLFEALSEWEKERIKNSSKTPPWEIKIDNMTASSAGAIVTMLSTVTLGTDYEPLSKEFKYGDPPPKNNLLYRSWVSDFGPEIFSNDDLPPIELESNLIHPILSIANSNYLRKMADKMCLPIVNSRPIPRWASGMKVFMTVTNMNGVPYSSEMCDSLNTEDKKFRMYKHSDCIGFQTTENKDPTLFSLNLESPRNCADWHRLYDTAAGSASVPLLFSAMPISRPYAHYKDLSITTPESTPDWVTSKNESYIYNFHASDGGLFNNEPIEVCKNSLEEKVQKKLNTKAQQSWGACILIDCNSNTIQTKSNNSSKNISLLECGSRLFTVMLNEAGFKYSDFFEAMDRNNFSQFIISPTRERINKSQSILATSTMGLFGGLLDDKIRHHDFLLGRKNCQEFLCNHFTMEANNSCQNEIFSTMDNCNIDQYSRTPIIPLFGSATKECPLPSWPTFSEEEKNSISEKFTQQVFNRLRAIFTTYARNIGLLKPAPRWRFMKKSRLTFVRLVINFVSMLASKWLEKVVKEALKNF